MILSLTIGDNIFLQLLFYCIIFHVYKLPEKQCHWEAYINVTQGQQLKIGFREEQNMLGIQMIDLKL